jgi:hypothetical protein
MAPICDVHEAFVDFSGLVREIIEEDWLYQYMFDDLFTSVTYHGDLGGMGKR